MGHDAVVQYDTLINSGAFIGGNVKIAHNVTLHTKAIIAPRCSVGAWTVIGAGSVVLRDVQEGVTVFGNPGKVI
jgi:acetyltransferase EpsM